MSVNVSHVSKALIFTFKSALKFLESTEDCLMRDKGIAAAVREGTGTAHCRAGQGRACDQGQSEDASRPPAKGPETPLHMQSISLWSVSAS